MEYLLYQTLCTYNLLVWKWIDQKFDIKWSGDILCSIFVDTAFVIGQEKPHMCVWPLNMYLLQNIQEELSEISVIHVPGT